MIRTSFAQLKALIKTLQMSFLKMLETEKADEKHAILLLNAIKIHEDLL